MLSNVTENLMSNEGQSKFEVGSAEWNPHYAHLSAISVISRARITQVCIAVSTVQVFSCCRATNERTFYLGICRPM